MNSGDSQTPFVLLAEDNADDQLLIRYAFKKAGMPNRYFIVTNGQEAIDWLSKVIVPENTATHPFPGLIVLDMRMPRMGGLEVLEWIRDRPQFREIPVVMMSNVSDPKSIGRALNLGARNYFLKPGDFGLLFDFITELNALEAMKARAHQLLPRSP